MMANRSMSFRVRSALAMSIVIGLGACAGPPAASEPIQSEDVATLEPEATNPVAASQPAATSAGNVLGNGRPVDITVTIAGSRSSDGSYHATGISRACGNAMLNFTGNTRAFNLEFPFEATPEIADVAFAAEDLVAGSTTSIFHVDVNVLSNGGNRPPSLVIDTTDSGPAGHTGSAQLSEANGTTTLVVDAVDDLGVSLRLTASCGPTSG